MSTTEALHNDASRPEEALPACITRDHLTGAYFPNTSLATLVAIITLGLIFMFTGFNRLNHTDLWGHLNFGRWMTEHHALPAADPFAAHPADAPVLQAAWLSQWLGYETQRLLGNEGLTLAHAVLVTLTAGILMLAAYRRGAPALWAWAAGAAMIVLDLPIVGTIRPQLFGQLGAALFLLAAAELPKRRHPLFWLPVVAALWVNLHGSILMGIAILGAMAIGTTWSGLVESGWKLGSAIADSRLSRAWLALVLVLAAACLNPHGPLLMVHTASFGENAALSNISEWQATRFSSLTGMLLLASLAMTVALAKLSPRKWDLFEIVLLCVFALATFSAIRMLAWWALVWPVVAVPHFAAAWRSRAGFQPALAGWKPAPQDEPTAMRTLMAMGVVFMTALLAPPSFALISGQPRGDGPIMVRETPLYLADELARRNVTGNIAAPMDWADYLVWKSNGRLKPLFYSHVHLADPQARLDHDLIFQGDPAWLDKLRKHQMQLVAVSRQRNPELMKAVLLDARGERPHVRLIYQDQRCVVAELLKS